MVVVGGGRVKVKCYCNLIKLGLKILLQLIWKMVSSRVFLSQSRDSESELLIFSSSTDSAQHETLLSVHTLTF